MCSHDPYQWYTKNLVSIGQVGRERKDKTLKVGSLLNIWGQVIQGTAAHDNPLSVGETDTIVYCCDPHNGFCINSHNCCG